MASQVFIETEECIGCQSCVELCSEVFAFDEEEEKAYVLDPDGADEACVEDALEACPSACITLEES